MLRKSLASSSYGLIFLALFLFVGCQHVVAKEPVGRERISINSNWRFWRSETNPDNVIYDQRPDLGSVNSTAEVLKSWILPTANQFIKNSSNFYQLPTGDPATNITFVQQLFDDSSWEIVQLPHDWAIKGPFYQGDNAVIGGGMGRLPVHGVGWYRRTLTMTSADKGRSVYLDIEGAMSYAMVWLNGKLVGGWPYGYNSFRLDLTPHLEFSDHTSNNNVLAIRLDNPANGSRWYPGAGLYRNVWITKTDTTHVAQSGTYITTSTVSAESATVNVVVSVENKANSSQKIRVVTDIYIFDPSAGGTGRGTKVSQISGTSMAVTAGDKKDINGSVVIQNPRLWQPRSEPGGESNLYVAITSLYADNAHTSMPIDTYETRFGIRSLMYDPNQGLLVNGVRVVMQGVNNHNDLGSLGVAFNVRAAQRQLEMLQDMGCNAVRLSHNPPAPELLDLMDRMGFLVVDEIFDSWVSPKTPSDFHLIFPEWHEPDLRSFIRRDRNHPSIIAWSYGNEVSEQYSGDAGAAMSQMLHDIVHDEDPTRQTTTGMNYAKAYMPFPRPQDIIGLNYQGSGIRNTNAYSALSGIRTLPNFPEFHSTFPEKMIITTESASALSSRGYYFFPVTNETSAPVNASSGGDPTDLQVSGYELYSADWGSSSDKVFASLDNNTYAASEFVWTGWDYLGEPTPYYASRSSYFGIIDLAGFKKDRYYMYQSRWRPDFKMAHILPHWTWPERVGQVTPVHVFSAADEAELFLNGVSQGRIHKSAFTYRFRWDQVVYQPGTLDVKTYKNGTLWTTSSVRTARAPSNLQLKADRTVIEADGYDLSFITVTVADILGDMVPRANNTIVFSIQGPGEIVATDNGYPADWVPFPSTVRSANNGLALAIVRAKAGVIGKITITASAPGLVGAKLIVQSTL